MNPFPLRFMLAFAALVSGLGYGRVAHADVIPFSQYYSYSSGLKHARVGLGEITIVTCDGESSGTTSPVNLRIWARDGSSTKTRLNRPGNDFTPGDSTTFTFEFPKNRVNELLKFAIEIEGSDAWCVDTVLLYANNGLLMSYQADVPLAGDRIYSQQSTTGSWNGDGSGTFWLSSDGLEGKLQMLFSDEYADETFVVPAFTAPNGLYSPGGSVRWYGYRGLPLRRSARWKQVEDWVARGVSIPLCALPPWITDGEMEMYIQTYMGNFFKNKSLYWGSGDYAGVSVKDAAKRIFKIDSRFKASVDVVRDPNVYADIDITPSCGFGGPNSKPGLWIKFANPSLDLEGGIVGLVYDLFDLQDYFFREPPKPIFIETGYCPSLSVGSSGQLVADWPDYAYSYVVGSGFGFEVQYVAMPVNPMCIDLSSVQKR